MRKFIFILISLIGIGATISFLFFDNDKPYQKSNKVNTIKVIEDKRSLTNLPIYLAISKDFFSEENLDVQLITASKGEEPLEIIQEEKGSCIYLCGPEEMIYQYQIDNKSDLKYFYNLAEREGSYIISKNPIPKFKINMLTDKSIIGSPRGTLREMTLEKFLHDNKLAPQRSVNIIQSLSYPDNIVALLSSKVDFIQLDEPEANKLISKKKRLLKISLANKIPTLLNKGLITSTENIRVHQKELQALTVALYKAQKWILNKPVEDYIDEIKKYYPDYTTNELRKGIQNYKASSVWTNDPTPTEDKFKGLEAVMDSAGELRRQLDPNLFLEKKFTTEAIKQ